LKDESRVIEIHRPPAPVRRGATPGQKPSSGFDDMDDDTPFDALT
jgi:hypothetical protein